MSQKRMAGVVCFLASTLAVPSAFAVPGKPAGPYRRGHFFRTDLVCSGKLSRKTLHVQITSAVVPAGESHSSAVISYLDSSGKVIEGSRQNTPVHRIISRRVGAPVIWRGDEFKLTTSRKVSMPSGNFAATLLAEHHGARVNEELTCHRPR